MEAAELKAEIRHEAGKAEAGRIRRKGYLPAVLYGKKIDTIPLKVNSREVGKLLDNVGARALIKVLLQKGDKEEVYTTLIREVQRHPVKGDPIHIDLYQVSMKEKFQTEVPVYLTGEAKGLKEGGTLQYGKRYLEVECLPANLPENIEVDVSDLGLGDKITVEDLPEIPGVEVLSSPDTVLVSLVAIRMTEEEEPTEEEEENLVTEAPEKEEQKE